MGLAGTVSLKNKQGTTSRAKEGDLNMSQPPYGPPPGNYPPPPPGGYGPPPGGPPPGGYGPPPGGYSGPPPGPPPPGYGPIPGGFSREMITTTLSFEGQKVVRYLGVVRGITVRSRSIIGNIGAGFQSLVGGKISIYIELCEKAREEAFDLMVQHAAQMGANAIIAMHYDANEVADGITEVLAYGTAVVLAPDDGKR